RKDVLENFATPEFRQQIIGILEKTGSTQQDFEKKEQEIGLEQMPQLMKFVCLRVIDTLWQDHLSHMDHLRDSVRLRGYGGKDPLIEYKNEGRRMFARLLEEIDATIGDTILKAG